MSAEQRATQSEPEMALAYLAEVANTYAQTLDKVAVPPFVGQVNQCIRLLTGAIEVAENAKASSAAEIAPAKKVK